MADTAQVSMDDSLDRDGWGPGPWNNEPDRMAWTDPATGLDCLIRRNTLGALCGYVAVPEDHPWHGTSYAEALCGHAGCYEHRIDNLLDVHGAATYSGWLEDDDSRWWLGFDCAHALDLVPAFGATAGDDRYRTMEFVRSECEKLARQIVEAA